MARFDSLPKTVVSLLICFLSCYSASVAQMALQHISVVGVKKPLARFESLPDANATLVRYTEVVVRSSDG